MSEEKKSKIDQVGDLLEEGLESGEIEKVDVVMDEHSYSLKNQEPPDTTAPDDHPIHHKHDTDLVLKDGVRSVWIEVGDLVVYLRRTFTTDPSDPEKEVPLGVAVDITPMVCAEETLDCCSATFEDAKDFECKNCGKYTGGVDYDFCEDCDPRQPCGHPESAIEGSEDGTNYCGLCAAEAANRPDETSLGIERMRDGNAEG